MFRIASTVAITTLALTATTAVGQMFQLTGEAEFFVQDLDPNDGFDIGTNYRNTALTITFIVPPQAGLTLENNRQSQGGSQTDYSGPTITDLTITGGSQSLDIDAVDAPIDATLVLWDRASFGPGERYYDIEFQIGSSRIDFSFRARPDDPSFDQMFSANTPDPNTVLDDFIPIGDTITFFDNNYRGADVGFDVFAEEFGGRGRFGYETTSVVLVQDFELGDINGSFTEDFFDLAAYLNNPTDFNNDGPIDATDVTDLIGALAD